MRCQPCHCPPPSALLLVLLSIKAMVDAFDSSKLPAMSLHARSSRNNNPLTASTNAIPSSASLDLANHHRYYLLRHGETDANAAEVIQGSSDVSRLTEKGREQAASVLAGLERVSSHGYAMHFDTVYCSPLTRARDTLAILRHCYNSKASAHDGNTTSVQLPPHDTILFNLREIDFYSWENRPKQELKAQFPAEYHAWKEAIPHALVVDDLYPLLETWDRAADVWKEIRQTPSPIVPSGDYNGSCDATLIVCHGTLGQALLSTAFGLDAATFRRNTFPNCGIAEIHWHPQRERATAWRWCHPPPPPSSSLECDVSRPISAYDLGCLREQLAVVLEGGGSIAN